MSKTIYPHELLTKLANKIKKNEKYVREQITKRAKGCSPEAYFVFWLNKCGIKSTLYQRQLSDGIKREIQSLIDPASNNIRTNVSPIKYRQNNIEKKLLLSELKISEKLPFISSEAIKDAYENAVVYQFLYIFENSVRKFIVHVLDDNHGEKWWEIDSVINKDIRGKVLLRKRDEKINTFHGKRGVHDIFYTDFSELATIIKNNAGIFNKYFSGIKGKTSFLTQKLEELSMTRNTIAHTCQLKKEDRERLLLYFNDWYKQIDQINTFFIKD